jgi:hypothetical protein
MSIKSNERCQSPFFLFNIHLFSLHAMSMVSMSLFSSTVCPTSRDRVVREFFFYEKLKDSYKKKFQTKEEVSISFS